MMWFLLLTGAVVTPVEPPHPLGNPGEWITTFDYPMEALRTETTGVVGVTMEVSPDGAVVACTVTAHSGSELLDDLTCNLLKLRARYSPARDRSGRAVQARVEQRVRWQIPGDGAGNLPPTDIHPFAFTLEFDVDAEGIVSNCEVTTAMGVPEMMDSLCDQYPEKVQPFRDSAGAPAARHVIFRSSATVEPPAPPSNAARPAN